MDVTITVDVDSAMEMVIQLFGLSFYYAAVATATLDSQIMAVVATIAVFGLSFFSSSAVADVAETMVVSK